MQWDANGRPTSPAESDIVICRAGRIGGAINATTNSDVARGVALVAASATWAASDTILLGPGGYQLSAGVTLPSNVNFVGSGYATRIYLADSVNASVNLISNADATNGNTNIRISNMRIDGNNTGNTTGTQKGVSLTKCTNSKVVGNWVEHFGRLATASCVGISTVGCTDCDIDGNEITDCVDGINPSSAANPCARLRIRGNSVTNTNKDFAINLFYITDSTISGNVLNATGHAINVQTGALRNVIIGNTINGSGASGINVALGAAGTAPAYNTIGFNFARGCLVGINVASTAGARNKILFNDVYGAASASVSDLVVDAAVLATTIVYGNDQQTTSVGTAPAF